MSLFKIPSRTEENTNKVICKAREEKEYRPKIKLGGNNLSKVIEIIRDNVNKALGDEKDNYLCITNDNDFIEYIKQAVKDGVIAIDTETTGLSFKEQGQLVGLCIQGINQKPAYVPYFHVSALTEKRLDNQVSREALIEGIKMISDSKPFLVWHNAYYDLVVIYLLCGIWLWVDWDTMVAGWLLNENEPHGLKELYNKYVMEGTTGVHKFNELFSGVPFCYIPYNIGYLYGGHDAEMTMKLYLFQKPYLTKGTEECSECDLSQSADIFRNMELPLIVPLCKMRVNGINIDNDKANSLKEKYGGLKREAEERYNNEIRSIKSAIERYNSTSKNPIQYPPNFNSPAQLSVLFYDILGVGVIDKKKPRGTGAEIIGEIAKFDNTASRIAKSIMEVKTFDKLLGSFIDKLPMTAMEYGGKIHTSLNQLGATTGRFSCSNPNLQQIPSKYKDIRHMFVPKDGHVFINCDYSQQEMMAVAALARDKLMLESFAKGRDIYSHIASIAFGVPYEECLEFYEDGTTNKEGKERRKKAKAIALGIVYGKGVTAIAEDLHVKTEKAQEIKDSILSAFPDLKKYLDNVVDYCKETGYVKTFFGRKRRLPDIKMDEYSFDFENNVEESTKRYYVGLYTGKLKKCRSLREKNDVIRNAMKKGIHIRQNGGFISKAIRESYNCVDRETQILTKQGWKNYNEIQVGDDVISYNIDKDILEFDKITHINIYEDDNIDVVEFKHPNMSAVSTPNHNWVVYKKYYKAVSKVPTCKLSHHGDDRILKIAGNDFKEAQYTDDFLRLCGWVLTDSSYKKNHLNISTSVVISQAKPKMVDRIQGILDRLHISAYRSTRSTEGNFDLTTWNLHKENSLQFFKLFPCRKLTYDFIFSLSQRQAEILLNEMILGDGFDMRRYVSSSREKADLFQCLSVVAGKGARISVRDSIGTKAYSKHIGNKEGYIETKRLHYVVGVLKRNKVQIYDKHCVNKKVNLVWCPTTGNGTWVARRNDTLYITGNSPVQGTAADITKRAMLNIVTNKRLNEIGAEMVLTIHDETMTSVPKEHAYEAAKLIEKCSIDAGAGLGAPLRCDIAISDRWEGKQYTFNDSHELILLEEGQD